MTNPVATPVTVRLFSAASIVLGVLQLRQPQPDPEGLAECSANSSARVMSSPLNLFGGAVDGQNGSRLSSSGRGTP